MNNNQPNNNKKAAKVITKRDIVTGSIAAIISLALIAFLIIMSLEGIIHEKGMKVAYWILVFILLIGGVFLIITNATDKKNKKKGLFIGGIIICILAVISIVFLAIGWL